MEDPAELFVGFTVLVALIYLVLQIATKSPANKTNRQIKKDRSGLRVLEKDYRWRRIKVLYITVSVILSALAGSWAYQTSSEVLYDPTYAAYTIGKPSTADGFFAMLTTGVILWIAFRLIAPRLFLYLKK